MCVDACSRCVCVSMLSIQRRLGCVAWKLTMQRRPKVLALRQHRCPATGRSSLSVAASSETDGHHVMRTPCPVMTTCHRTGRGSVHLSACCAANRHYVTTPRHTKAVIFDMGGVLIPSPLPFLTSMYQSSTLSDMLVSLTSHC